MRGRRKDKKRGKGDAGGGLFEDHAEPRPITPVDIQQKEFRLAMRGYHERDVDEFLDEITEEVARLYAENKRLQEELESRVRARISGAGEAEAVVRQAREEAARILQEAEVRVRSLAATAGAGVPAASPAAAVTGAALASFLSREKSFLQNLAKMMQDHANAMKEDVRRVRQSATQKPAPAAAPPAEPIGSPRDWAEPQTAGGVPEEPGPDRSHEMWRPEPGSAAAEPESAPRAAEPSYEPEPAFEQRPAYEPEAAYEAAPANEPTELSTEQPPYFMDDRSVPSESGIAESGDPSALSTPPEPEPRWDQNRWDDQFGKPPGEVASHDPGVASNRLGIDEAPSGTSDVPHPELYVDEPTREWTLGEPGIDAGEVDEMAAEPSPEERTAEERPADLETAGGETPRSRWVPQPDEEKPEDERSIRELFWGED